MKKAGIITFHRAINCGAVLQAYALQEKLKQNFDVYILDYRCDYIEEVYYNPDKYSTLLRKVAKNIIFWKKHYYYKKKRQKFEYFQQNYLHLSQIYRNNNIGKANEIFDLFIAGSDQIWNPIFSHGDENYFLGFADRGKKYSYAASFGGKQVDDAYRKKITALLNEFSSVLVREEEGKEYADFLLGEKRAVTVCDPVFLLDKKEWKNKLGLKEKDGEYILLYLIAKTRYAVDFARQISRTTGKKVLFFNASGRKNVDAEFTDIRDAGPVDFLNYILGASCVITSSFHALAFSIIFNIPFYYELNHETINSNSRIENIAKIFGIIDREITDVAPQTICPLNWMEINERVKAYSDNSMQVLTDSIANEKD